MVEDADFSRRRGHTSPVEPTAHVRKGRTDGRTHPDASVRSTVQPSTCTSMHTRTRTKQHLCSDLCINRPNLPTSIVYRAGASAAASPAPQIRLVVVRPCSACRAPRPLRLGVATHRRHREQDRPRPRSSRRHFFVARADRRNKCLSRFFLSAALVATATFTNGKRAPMPARHLQTTAVPYTYSVSAPSLAYFLRHIARARAVACCRKQSRWRLRASVGPSRENLRDDAPAHPRRVSVYGVRPHESGPRLGRG